MKSTRKTRLVIAARLVVVFLGMTQAAGAMAARRSDVMVRPTADHAIPFAIAQMPVVACVDDPAAIHEVQDKWMEFCGKKGYAWKAPDEVRAIAAKTSRRPDSLLKEMAQEIRNHGHLGPESARALGRLLGVEAMLTVRIDRWESVASHSQVELTVALVDSSGRILWKVSGLAGDGRTQPSRLAFRDDPSTAWIGGSRNDPGREVALVPTLRTWGPRLEEPYESGDPERALDLLLTRWLAIVPCPESTRLLAGEPARTR